MQAESAATTSVPLPHTSISPTVVPFRPKAPILALLLSLFPGIGQIYNGQPAKALAFFFGWASCIWMASESDGSPMPFALMIPFIYFYNLIDAYRSAVFINARRAGTQEVEYDDNESPAWGWTLVIVGVLLLLNNLGWVPLHAMRRFWPLLLIAAGAWFAYSSVQRRSSTVATAPEPDHGRLV